MFKRLAISLEIDSRNKEVFESLLIKHQIPINTKAMIPYVDDPYFSEKNIKVCIYSTFLDDFHDYEKIEMLTYWHEHMHVNAYLNEYLNKYRGLSVVKEYFLESSYLLLIFEGLIKHDDIIGFTPETISNLAILGLGISYNHVYNE